jgi:hypothetical protein
MADRHGEMEAEALRRLQCCIPGASRNSPLQSPYRPGISDPGHSVYTRRRSLSAQGGVGRGAGVGRGLGVGVGLPEGVVVAVGVAVVVGLGVGVSHGTNSCASSTNIPVRSPNPSSCAKNSTRTVCPAKGVMSTVWLTHASVSRH